MLRDSELIYVEVIYRYRCKQCKQVYSEFEDYIKHHLKTKHMGVILQVITHDKLTELP